MATYNGLIIDEDDCVLIASPPPSRVFTGGVLVEDCSCESMYKPPRQIPLEISWTKGRD
jgi:hypothetical protein